MKIMIVTHSQYGSPPDLTIFDGVLDRHMLKFLYYGSTYGGLAADVFIVVEPPLDPHEEEWFKYAKLRMKPKCVYINPDGVVANPYEGHSNDT